MTAALRLMEVSRSAKPLDNNGTMMDKVAMVTSETKVVAPKMWTVSGTSVGLEIHSINFGMNFSISLLWTVSVEVVMVAVAAFLTSGLVSHMASDKTGINSGILKATWASAWWTKAEMAAKMAVFSVHLLVSSKDLTKCGNKDLTACGLMALAMANKAAAAASATSLSFSPAFLLISGTKATMYGSTDGDKPLEEAM
ncbi:hypothetical protein WICPIJ_007660 [Wickerhamomyces pijperi]|uniref:Uncharacterized protein n=1 Tax=Wickerhamomyces pijperi TaxID=599730 RepID=A0A9P8TJQ6_WICPI|nr:hypothetical protein WICPIJ_007660 [Wickerhamomyces pijperi]